MAFSIKEHYNFQDMLEIMKILRAPNGCPWDREQDHHSIRNNFIEETYEAVEAIDTDNVDLMREELGDVLLQVLFHCQIESEKGNFTFADVVDELAHKMIERHPHVFSTVKVNSSKEVLKNWDVIKNHTKHRDSGSEILKAVSPALPALMRAAKVQKKAQKLGFPEEIEAEENEKTISPEKAGAYLFEAVRAVKNAGVEPEEMLSKETEAYLLRYESWEKSSGK